MKKLNIRIEGPESAMEVMKRCRQKMLDVKLCAPFTVTVGMIVGTLTEALGKDAADTLFSEMVAASALLQGNFDDDDDDGKEPVFPMVPIVGMSR